MNVNNQQSSSNNFFVLADSHAKFISSRFATSSYSLTTRSIPGLKWIDYREEHLSVFAALSWPEIQSSLSQADAVLFLVGTNSVRILRAKDIIRQIEQVVSYVHEHYPNLSQPGRISISITFSCFKTTRSFPSNNQLMFNIDIYNEQLRLLASRMNFNILDFYITPHHLANNDMHMHYRFRDHIFNSITDHFDQVDETILRTTTTITTDTNSPSSSVTTSTSDPIPAKKK